MQYPVILLVFCQLILAAACRTLRFAGKIPLDVNKLNLHINDDYGGDNEYATSPKIIINGISVRYNANFLIFL